MSKLTSLMIFLMLGLIVISFENQCKAEKHEMKQKDEDSDDMNSSNSSTSMKRFIGGRKRRDTKDTNMPFVMGLLGRDDSMDAETTLKRDSGLRLDDEDIGGLSTGLKAPEE